MAVNNRSHFSVACHTIIFGQQGRDDLAGTLNTIADAGYAGLESGAVTTIDTATYTALLQQHGLAQAGVHMSYQAQDKLEDFIAFCHATGARVLACSGVGDYKNQEMAAYEAAAERFNAIGRRCADEGIVFCYHNHAWEFQEYDGVVALDRLYALTDPTLVKLCPDVYWVHVGGKDPAEFLRTHAERIAYIHLKDGYPQDFREIGQGPLDWESIWAAVQALPHVEWLTVEQDRTTREPRESIRMSREYLRNHFGL